jgi:hypothetical protein
MALLDRRVDVRKILEGLTPNSLVRVSTLSALPPR